MKVGSLRVSVEVPVKIRQCNFEKGKPSKILNTNFLEINLYGAVSVTLGLIRFFFWADSLKF
jgi:hypothetical protein